jgi:hypothetical protein
MPDEEHGHLSDMEISLLVAGQGSRALRRTLSSHLVDCADCRALLAEAARASRTEHPTETADPRLVESVLDAMLATAPEAMGAGETPRTIRLERRAEDPIVALAAEPAARGPLLTLFSPDGTIVVCVERAGRGRGLRARVSRQGVAQRGAMWLVFRGPGLCFRIGDGEVVPLPGVEESHLTAGTIEIEFRA